MNIFRMVVTIIFFSISAHLYAKNYEYSGNCKFYGDIEILESCLNREVSIYDQELNGLYNKLFKKNHDALLRKSELSWVQFKESDCAFMARTVNDGVYYQIVERACIIDKTKKRIKDLKRSFFMAEWFEDNE